MDIRTLLELKKEHQKLGEKIEELRKPLNNALQLFQHLGEVIAGFDKKDDGDEHLFVDISADTIAQKLRGLTHKQAVVAIARINGGVILSGDAKRQMIRAGIMRPTKNANRMVHNAIKTSKQFDLITPGKYRLKTKQSEVESNGSGASKEDVVAVQ